MIKDRLFLLAATVFWGCAFVAQRVSTDTMGAFAFNGLRFWLGALAVLPVALWIRRQTKSDEAPDRPVPVCNSWVFFIRRPARPALLPHSISSPSPSWASSFTIPCA